MTVIKKKTAEASEIIFKYYGYNINILTVKHSNYILGMHFFPITAKRNHLCNKMHNIIYYNLYTTTIYYLLCISMMITRQCSDFTILFCFCF